VNLPPVATIRSPAADSFYVSGTTIALAGSATDLQSPPDSLTLHWIVDLVFGSHVQPAFLAFDGPAASFDAADWDDGSGVHLVVKLTATDPGGLVSDTARVALWPEVDLAPSAVTVTPDPPLAGRPAHYAFTLANGGRMPAPASHWVLRAGATVLAQGDAAVPAQGSVDVGADATLPAIGTFTLRLTADSLGAVFETSEANDVALRSLTVAPDPADVPPVAVAGASPTSGLAPLAVTFSGAASTDADGDSLAFAWAFGDGATATGRLASHTYAATGSYAALLTVLDARGGSDTASVPIAVTAPVVSFPLTPVLDTFNRANGAIGGNWIDQVTGFVIASNQLAPAKNADTFVEWNGAVYGPNQEAFVTLSTSPASAPEQNLMLKTQGTTWSAGHLEVSYRASAAKVVVSTFTPPRTWTVMGTITSITLVPGSQLGARATSDGVVRVYRNGTSIGTVSVPAYAALGGRIGVSVSKSIATRFDNFGGGNVPASLVTLAPSAPLASQAGVPEVAGPPTALALSAAFPNPSRGGVALRLDLPVACEAGLRVVDVLGREVWHAPDAPYAAGRWTLMWDGRGPAGPVRPGLYLAIVRAGDSRFVRRFAVVQ